VLWRKNAAIGPARRPSRLVLGAAAAGAVLVVALAIGLWSSRKPSAPAVTRVDLTLPPVAAPAPVEPEASGEAALIERGATGPLPRIAADGRTPWQAYARPFDRSNRRPRIAIVVVGLGQSAAQSEAAISKLPGAVTLAFSPYAPDLPVWFEKAHAAEHELMLQLPMEPVDFPREDPGPYALLTTLTPKENLDRLEWVMSRATGYVGFTNFMGSRFTATADVLRPTLEVLKGRGLLFLETRASNQSVVATTADEFGLPRAVDDRNFDGDLSRAGIDQALGELEQIARRKDGAVGVGSAYPITIDRIAAWAATVESKGVVLAPLSAMVVAKEPAKDTPKEASEAKP
jgi:polysaccharide deacetylase 2 family uncharacterized protein YibQ